MYLSSSSSREGDGINFKFRNMSWLVKAFVVKGDLLEDVLLFDTIKN